MSRNIFKAAVMFFAVIALYACCNPNDDEPNSDDKDKFVFGGKVCELSDGGRFEFRNDGTAEYIGEDDEDKIIYKYSYDNAKKTLSLEKFKIYFPLATEENRYFSKEEIVYFYGNVYPGILEESKNESVKLQAESENKLTAYKTELAEVEAKLKVIREALEKGEVQEGAYDLEIKYSELEENIKTTEIEIQRYKESAERFQAEIDSLKVATEVKSVEEFFGTNVYSCAFDVKDGENTFALVLTEEYDPNAYLRIFVKDYDAVLLYNKSIVVYCDRLNDRCYAGDFEAENTPVFLEDSDESVSDTMVVSYSISNKELTLTIYSDSGQREKKLTFEPDIKTFSSVR